MKSRLNVCLRWTSQCELASNEHLSNEFNIETVHALIWAKKAEKEREWED